MSSRSSQTRKARLSCRIDSDLLSWIQWYAAQRGTTVTSLVEENFKRLRMNYRNRNKVEVEQV